MTTKSAIIPTILLHSAHKQLKFKQFVKLLNPY